MTGSRKRQRGNSPLSNNKSYYPIYLDLRDRRCLIIGGGRVAERKCISLMKTGADVTIISPDITKRLEDLKRRGIIRHIPRPYRKGDLRGAFLVIAATDSEDVNKRVFSEAIERNLLLNVVDNPGFCNFIVPSVFEQGVLKIAISTGGASPGIAKRIRKELGSIYNRDFSRYLDLVKEVRFRIREEVKDRKRREEILNKLSSEELFIILRKKGFRTVREEIMSLLSNLS
jgi:precorrin-2 dehydrogenase/sirohydrochlorin ferrochelatase